MKACYLHRLKILKITKFLSLNSDFFTRTARSKLRIAQKVAINIIICILSLNLAILTFSSELQNINSDKKVAIPFV